MPRGGPGKSRNQHGMRGWPEYVVWDGMIQRCTNPQSTNYPWYGGRGVVVCPEWRASFEQFVADMGRRPNRHATIERIDNSGPYSPGNCVWATRHRQMRNTRSNHMLTYNGVTQCVTDWAHEVGLLYNTIITRLAAGWTVEQALTTSQQRGKKPTEKKNARLVTYNGKTQSMAAWEAEYGFKHHLLTKRLNAGWDVERALTTPKELRRGR